MQAGSLEAEAGGMSHMRLACLALLVADCAAWLWLLYRVVAG